MHQSARQKQKQSLDRQAAAGVALMLAASAALLFLAWLSIPVPLVMDTVQTELLYVQVYLSPGECVTWHPRSMTEQQTARAVVDYMGTCRERNTLCPAGKTMADQPRMQVYFRTEDTYRVVCLGDWAESGEETGWVGDQDYSGLAARVLNANLLMNYIYEQIGDNLPLSKDR